MSVMELRESTAFENTTHKESNGKFIVAGQFSKADLRNENGRVYRRSMWENVLHRPNIIDALKKRKMLGELGHPDKIETTPLNVSHIVTNLELKPNGEIYGEAEILDTPSGRVLKTLYEAGVTMGISSRGYLPEGSNLFAEGEDLIVPDDYELITFDFVIDPSSQGAEPVRVQESVKTTLTNILTESREKLNPDTISFIEGVQTLSESDEKSGTQLIESSDCTKTAQSDDNKYIEKKEDVASMSEQNQNELYTAKLEEVVGDLKKRYLTAESVIKDFVKERTKADEMLKGVTDRYLTAEQACEGLRDYSLKLEETVDQVITLYRKSESVIKTLRDQYKVSEDVITDLKNRYTLSESVINQLAKSCKAAEDVVALLRDRYTLSESALATLAHRYSIAECAIKELADRAIISESVILGLKDRLQEARKANVSLKQKILTLTADSNTKEVDMQIQNESEQIDKLNETIKLQESVISEMKKQLEEFTKQEATPVVESKPALVPVPNSYFEDCAQKYGVSIQECKNIFKELGCRKSSFEFHMQEMKRATRNNYSEFPYMVDGSTASHKLMESKKNSEIDMIARLVEGAF